MGAVLGGVLITGGRLSFADAAARLGSSYSAVDSGRQAETAGVTETAGVKSNIRTLSFGTPPGSGNYASLRTTSMWRGTLGVFPLALP